MLSSGNKIWVRSGTPPGETPSWDVFGSDGLHVATVEAINGWDLLDVSEEVVVQLGKGPLDEELIGVVQLRKN